MAETRSARFHYRLGANQPAESATARRLAEMAEAIGRDTDGEFRLDVFPESRLGPDPQMFADLRAGKLEFYLSGALLGGVAPTSALPLLPFAFRDSKAVFAALDGALGDMIRHELAQAGLHGFPRSWQNGFHHITTSTRPIESADDFAGLDKNGGPFDKGDELLYVSRWCEFDHDLKEAKVILLNDSSAIVIYEVRYKYRRSGSKDVLGTESRQGTGAWAKRNGQWWYVYKESHAVSAEKQKSLFIEMPQLNAIELKWPREKWEQK